MNPPGAPMSGLSVRSGERPQELKEEIWLAVEFGVLTTCAVQVIVTGPAATRLLMVTPSGALSGLMVNEARLSFTFSNDATPITFSPRPGAPPEYRPFAPLLPKEATTTMPWLTRRLAATPVGDCGQVNAAPMLMFSTCM